MAGTSRCARRTSREGQDEAWRWAQRNARVSLFLSRCVACGKRGRLAFPVAGLLALPWLVLAALVGWLLAVGFVARLSDAWLGSAGAALLVLGYSTASRLARADNAVKPG